MEKSVVPKLRAGVASALALPFGLAAFAAALTSGEPPVQIMTPVLCVVIGALAICWLRVAAHRRRHGPEDDDQPWRRDGGGDDPRRPDGDAGGPPIDWPAFERDFAAYVRERERSPGRVLTRAG